METLMFADNDAVETTLTMTFEASVFAQVLSDQVESRGVRPHRGSGS